MQMAFGSARWRWEFLGTTWSKESDANPPEEDTKPPWGNNPWCLLFSSSMSSFNFYGWNYACVHSNCRNPSIFLFKIFKFLAWIGQPILMVSWFSISLQQQSAALFLYKSFFLKLALKNSIHTPVGREERDHGQVDQLQLKEAFVEDKAGKVFGFLLGFPMLITEFIGNKSL